MLTGEVRGDTLDMLNEFRVEVAEPGELVLVQVHHEKLVRGGEVRGLRGKLDRSVSSFQQSFFQR